MDIDKSKDKKKSLVERFMDFASHTMRFHRKSDPKKKSNKSTIKYQTNNLTIHTMMQIPAPQTCTFCDFCDEKIVADFTGQNFICHDSCKTNNEDKFSVELNEHLEKSLELLSSTKSEIYPIVRDITSRQHTNVNGRISISLNDLSICDESQMTIVRRSDRERSVGISTGENYLVDNETGSYTFSTIDLSTIKRCGISIKKIATVMEEPQWKVDNGITRKEVPPPNGRLSRDSCTSIDYMRLLPDDLRTMIEIFNNNDQGLFIEPSDNQIMGKVRVFINLLRPIKMLLTARPPSIFDMNPDITNYADQSSTIERVYYNKEVIFRLPRGTTKLLYININCLTDEVISLLLSKFNIQNNPKKFSLYQHTIKSPTEVEVCKLRPTQCPLKITLDWCSRGLDYFLKNLATKRFVLQENDPGTIEWEGFSAPELKSFLTILDQEKEEQKKQVERKYKALRDRIDGLLASPR